MIQVAPPLNSIELQSELQAFVSEIRAWVAENKDMVAGPRGDAIHPEEGSRSDDEERVELDQTTLCQMFWTHVSSSHRKLNMKQWVLLAQLIFVMVPESVEEERMFSAMKYLKNLQRNKLQEKHLTIYARAFHHPRISLSSFPFAKAIRRWAEQKERRMV